MNCYEKSAEPKGEPQKPPWRVQDLLLPASVFVILTSLALCNVTLAAPFPVWVASSLTRVGPSDVAGSTSAIALYGARGETVDAQVIVQASAGGLTNVNLSASG